MFKLVWQLSHFQKPSPSIIKKGCNGNSHTEKISSYLPRILIFNHKILVKKIKKKERNLASILFYDLYIGFYLVLTLLGVKQILFSLE